MFQEGTMSEAGIGSPGQMNRTDRRRVQRKGTGKRSRRIAAASVIAVGGLASGYLQALRQPPSAYAASYCYVPTIQTDSDLNLAILDFNNGGCDTLNFAPNATIDLYTSIGPIVMGASAGNTLEIRGNGADINGRNRRPFEIAMDGGDTLTISNLTILDASSRDDALNPSGGAIAVNDTYSFHNGGTVTLDQVQVTNSAARTGTYPAYTYYYGGAVFLNADDVTITDCTFTGNAGAKGGAVYVGQNESTDGVTVTNSVFHENDAFGGGGAIYLYQDYTDYDPSTTDLVIASSTFTNNYGAPGGGAISSRGDVSITSSSLTGNSVDLGDGDAWGGAVLMYGYYAGYGLKTVLTVTNSFIGDNSTYFYGGISSENGLVELYFSTLYDNYSDPSRASEVSAQDLTTVGSAIGSSTTSRVLFSSNTPLATNSVATSLGQVTSNYKLPVAGDNVAPGTFDLGPFDALLGPGQAGRTPSNNSPLTKAIAAGGFAPPTNPTASMFTPITVDQLGVTRTDPFTIGARQVPAALVAPSFTAASPRPPAPRAPATPATRSRHRVRQPPPSPWPVAPCRPGSPWPRTAYCPGYLQRPASTRSRSRHPTGSIPTPSPRRSRSL